MTKYLLGLICLIGFSLFTFRTCVKIWWCFGSYLYRNIENSKGFTNFQAALYLLNNLSILIYYNCLKHKQIRFGWSHTGAPLRILGPLDSIFTRALLRSGRARVNMLLYITEIAIAFPSQSFFPLLPNQIIQFQLLKSFSFVCNGKVIIFRFVFL